MPTKNATFNVEELLQADSMAEEISNLWTRWNESRRRAVNMWEEVKAYVFATDTRTTSNSSLPWKNTTTVPKLCQIRDNLAANYMSSLFPKRNWVTWEAAGRTGVDRDKRETIINYIDDKVRFSGFRQTMELLVNDYIDTGNCFAIVEHVNERREDAGEKELRGYYGPRIYRIAPSDIVFNPTATSFIESPKIIRSVLSLGDIRRMVEDDPTNEYLEGIFRHIKDIRDKFADVDPSDYDKLKAFQAAGLGNFMDYMQSGSVEVLDFYGDLYEQETDTLHRNCVISVVDRLKVLRNVPNPSWMRHPHIYQAGWRKRPDNLLAMGPLDNLVGMQYRIDHLENLKADVFDQIGYPMLKIAGDVHDFKFGPGERIYVGDEGDVSYLAPDATVLNADFQIRELERKMEEMAGAPREAMGIRTPGEKTAFEVQKLDNAAGRIFQNKIQNFEETFVEPLLNAMLEVGRRRIDSIDTIRVFNSDLGITKFQDIVPEDLTASGRLVPVAARHFAEKAELIQNLHTLFSSAVGQDPGIRPHLSGKAIAQLVEELLGLEQRNLFGDNIQITEQIETQRLAQAAQEQASVEAQTPAPGAIEEDDVDGLI